MSSTKAMRTFREFARIERPRIQSEGITGCKAVYSELARRWQTSKMLHNVTTSDTLVAHFPCNICHTKLRVRVKHTSIGHKVGTVCPSCEASLCVRIRKRFAHVPTEPTTKTCLVQTVKKTRNERRNAPIGHPRACKHCQFVWPETTHLGRFESYQSRCVNGKMACANVKPRSTSVV